MDRRFIQPLRLTVAWGFLLFQLWLIGRFAMFVLHFRSGSAVPLAVWRRRMDPLIFAILVIGIFYGGTLIGRLTGHWHTAVSYGEYARLLGP